VSAAGWTSEVAALATLEPAARTQLETLVPGHFPVGTVLFQPGDAVRGYLVLLSGQVDVRLPGRSGRELTLYTIAPGQACIQSTLGLLGGDSHYSAEAVVTRAARGVLLPRATFLSLLDSSPAFRRAVHAAMAERMQATMQRLERIAFEPVSARLARALLARADADGLVRAHHKDLAADVGTAREVISRHLAAMERRGQIATERGVIRLLDADALAKGEGG